MIADEDDDNGTIYPINSVLYDQGHWCQSSYHSFGGGELKPFLNWEFGEQAWQGGRVQFCHSTADTRAASAVLMPPQHHVQHKTQYCTTVRLYDCTTVGSQG